MHVRRMTNELVLSAFPRYLAALARHYHSDFHFTSITINKDFAKCWLHCDSNNEVCGPPPCAVLLTHRTAYAPQSPALTAGACVR